MFDIVIPVGPKDFNLQSLQLEYTRKNIIGYRNIYIILDLNIIKKLNKESIKARFPNGKEENIIYIDENIFPFNKQTISLYHKKYNKDRNGWYLQQLIKLYSGIFIPGILEKYLVIDTDTFFLKPTSFINNGKCLYSYGKEYHKPYFSHMKKLYSDFDKVYIDKSGICHHMIFETVYIKELFEKVETVHKKEFWVLFLLFSDLPDPSSASEYEIYFNYMFKYHKDKVEIRELQWKNVGDIKNIKNNENNENNDFVSYHWYMR